MWWEYYDENIGSDNVVASLYEAKGKTLLDVLEGIDGHYTIPRISFMDLYSISYSKESKLAENTILPTDTTAEVLKKCLIAGCKEIEKNYIEQTGKNKIVIG